MSPSRLLSWLCPLALLLASPALAAADALELQLPADKVLPLLADRARAGVTCFAPFQAFGTDIYVDHLEFPSPPTLRRSPALKPVTINSSLTFNGHPLQIVLPVQAFLKTKTALEDPNVPQEQYLSSPTASVILDLAVGPNGSGQQQLCATPSAIEPSVLGGPELLSALQQQMGTPCFPLTLDGLDDILDGKVAQTGQAISANAALDRLAIRLEFDHPTPSLSSWQSFVDSGTLSSGAGSGFALIFDKALLARVLRSRFNDELNDPQLTVESPGLQTQWSPYGLPALNVFFNAQMDIVGCANTIGAHPVNIGMGFGLNGAGDAVTLNGQVSWDLVDSDVALCALTWGLISGHWGILLDGAVLGVIGGITSNLSFPGDNLPAQCSQGANNSFSCGFPLVLPSLAAGGGSALHTDLKATALQMVGSGLVISGTATLGGYTRAAPRAQITAGPVQYGIHGGCSSLHTGFEGSFVATGAGKVCETMQVKGDPLGVFVIQGLSQVYAAPWDKDVLFGFGDTAAYAASPYAAKVTARTSGGGRTVKLGPVQMPTAAEQFEISNEFIQAKVNCMAKQTGLFGIPGKFDPRWHVDPPVDLVGTIRTYDPRYAGVVAKVTLENVVAETLGRTTRPLGLTRFNLAEQDVRLSATAVVSYGRLGTQKVPVSTVVRGTLVASEIGRTEIILTKFSAPTRANFTLQKGSLLSGMEGLDFSVDVSPGKFSMQGTLEAR